VTRSHAQLCALCLTLAVFPATGQTPGAAPVEAHNATIRVSSSPARAESVVVAEIEHPVRKESSQVVYFIQHTPGGHYPAEWSGRGRLLTSNGMLVALGADDGFKAVFRFSERPVPASVRRLVQGVEHSLVYGIAIYKGNLRLTEEQIQNLRTNGNVSADLASDCSCDSGGAGATQCSITAGTVGCSVTCDTQRRESYACCTWTSAGQPVCKCCP
jgi:hypothetical protein